MATASSVAQGLLIIFVSRTPSSSPPLGNTNNAASGNTRNAWPSWKALYVRKTRQTQNHTCSSNVSCCVLLTLCFCLDARWRLLEVGGWVHSGNCFISFVALAHPDCLISQIRAQSWPLSFFLFQWRLPFSLWPWDVFPSPWCDLAAQDESKWGKWARVSQVSPGGSKWNLCETSVKPSDIKWDQVNPNDAMSDQVTSSEAKWD